MTNKEFQQMLSKHPDDIKIKLLIDKHPPHTVVEFTEENIMLTSETVHVDVYAPEELWDCEDGLIDFGDGERYLLLNPIIT